MYCRKVFNDECLTFFFRYLHGIETKFNRVERNYDGSTSTCNTSQLSIFSTPIRHLGKAIRCELNDDLHKAATFYVLQNCVNAKTNRDQGNHKRLN